MPGMGALRIIADPSEWRKPPNNDMPCGLCWLDIRRQGSGDMRRVIRFLLNGELQEMAAVDPTLTVLDWLRLHKRLTGTKEGCAEGDCGACTILVGRLDCGGLSYEAFNACIRFVATLDGCHVVTVDYLKRRTGHLHPVQQAMVECHGSQCGFCTPGIVMSLLALWLAHDSAPNREQIEEALAGNLCRCTGYGPIIIAMGRAYEIAQPCNDVFRSERAEIAARLAQLADGEPVAIGDGDRRFLGPASLDQLAGLCEEYPDATIVAGATDVGLWITKDLQRPKTILYLGRVAGLADIADHGDHLALGAMVSLARSRLALATLHPHIDELLRRFGSQQVRNAGTIGGNIANGSPIGDLAPVLIALGASLTLRQAKARRTLPVQDFFLAYKKQDLRPCEFVETVHVPKLQAGALLHVSKISKRFDEDISALCGAFYLALDASGKITEARLAFGGMAATPRRAARAEAALLGQAFSREAAAAAADAIAGDFTPLDDWRASARYRSAVAANLVRRFYLESSGPSLRVAGLLREAADG